MRAATRRAAPTEHPAITAGYHLNKRHWNTITLDGSLADRMVADMIEDSYDLIVSRLSPGRRRGLGGAATIAEADAREQAGPSGGARA